MPYPIARDYTWTFPIRSYEVGPDRRLRLSNQLKLQQEVGELHFGEAGLGYEELCRHGVAFLLTQLNSVIRRAPVLGETVRLKTWHRDSRGAQFYRCYQFTDEGGNVLIDSVTAFALVDVNTHRLLRPGVFDEFGLEQQPDRRGDCPDPGKWKLPDTLRPAGERRIRWSDIDCNRHVNNTVYADILCDALAESGARLDGGAEPGYGVKEFSIAFVHEALEGETISLRACRVEPKPPAAGEGASSEGTRGAGIPDPGKGESVFWLAGEKPDGRRCFEARAVVRPEEGTDGIV